MCHLHAFVLILRLAGKAQQEAGLGRQPLQHLQLSLHILGYPGARV